MTALVWLRRDLRIHDNPSLRAALDHHERVVPVFLFYDRPLHGRHDEYLLEPWTMPVEVQRRVGCVIGEDYPPPMVDHLEARQSALARFAID